MWVQARQNCHLLKINNCDNIYIQVFSLPWLRWHRIGIHHEKGTLYLTHSVHVSMLGLLRTDRFYARATDHSDLDEWSKDGPFQKLKNY